MNTSIRNLISVTTLGLLAPLSQGAIMITPQSSVGTPFASTPWAPSLSSTDLVNAGQPTLAGSTVSSSFFGPAGTNDGAAGPGNTSQNTYVSSDGGGLGNDFTDPGGTWWATYDLDVSTNTLGYDLTSIETFLGWQANSELHANQSYAVLISLVGSAGYSLLTTVSFTPFSSVNGADHESHVAIIEDTTGVLASGVDSIRFEFNDPGNGGASADGTVIREIDVEGVATVIPEPSGLALLGLALGFAAIRRRR